MIRFFQIFTLDYHIFNVLISLHSLPKGNLNDFQGSSPFQCSSGMQITISKGPDDQTQRVVNSDNNKVDLNGVDFGEKKYIGLQCPHCNTICVTFNVSTI